MNAGQVVGLVLIGIGCLIMIGAAVYELVQLFRSELRRLEALSEFPEVEESMRRHPAGKARRIDPGADRGQFWATLGTPDVLAVDRTRQELADYELVKQKLKGVRGVG